MIIFQKEHIAEKHAGISGQQTEDTGDSGRSSDAGSTRCEIANTSEVDHPRNKLLEVRSVLEVKSSSTSPKSLNMFSDDNESDDKNKNDHDEVAEVGTAIEIGPLTGLQLLEPDGKTGPDPDVSGVSKNNLQRSVDPATSAPGQEESLRTIAEGESRSKSFTELGSDKKEQDSVQILYSSISEVSNPEAGSKTAIERPRIVRLSSSLLEKNLNRAVVPRPKTVLVANRAANAGLNNNPRASGKATAAKIFLTPKLPHQVDPSWVLSGKTPKGQNLYVMSGNAPVGKKDPAPMPEPLKPTGSSMSAVRLHPNVIRISSKNPFSPKPANIQLLRNVSRIRNSDVSTDLSSSESPKLSMSESPSPEIRNLSEFSPSTFKCKVKLDDVDVRPLRKRKGLFVGADADDDAKTDNDVDVVDDSNDEDWQPEDCKPMAKKQKVDESRNEKADVMGETQTFEVAKSPESCEADPAQTQRLIGDKTFWYLDHLISFHLPYSH